MSVQTVVVVVLLLFYVHGRANSTDQDQITKGQSDHDLHCLPFHIHHLNACLLCKSIFVVCCIVVLRPR